MTTALDHYQTIEDLSFPPIDPNMTDYDLDLLVDGYVQKIRQINPLAVHIMGELVFTHRLVNRLTAIGISCIASTTERKVIVKKNITTSEFGFAQFRHY